MSSSRSIIRILSDLHLGHPASLIDDTGQLEPLLEGATKAVFNGDTVELRLGGAQTRSRRALDSLVRLCRNLGVDPLLINGNHDPDVSERDHLELMDGRILVTHGHVLFPEITPWGRDAAELGEANARALQEMSSNGMDPLEQRLLAARLACARRLPETGSTAQSPLKWLGIVLAEMLHPRRPFQVLRAWRLGPGLAAGLAATHRPAVRCILFGHTHRPGWWKRGDTSVLNTGSFLPWLGRRLVEISGSEIAMREVRRSRGRFHPGRELFRQTLPPHPASADAGAPPPPGAVNLSRRA
jgi:predicted phosphodiesterase